MNSYRAALISGVLVTAVSGTGFAADYRFDAGHTEVRFAWNHAGISNQTAEFTTVDGTVFFDPDNIAEAKVDVSIDPNSVWTGLELFDGHMKGEQFFNTANHPTITFVSTAVRQTGASSAQVDGDLTIKGITKPVTLDVELTFQGEHPLGAFSDAYKGAQYAAFSASTQVLRSDFDLGAYAPLTSDAVDIMISTELRQEGT
ncbi:MAG: YceI family protein [Geminicoccaceae bacterium]